MEILGGILDKTRETRKASQTLELNGPLELVSHDSNEKPAGIDRPGTLGVMFQVPPPPQDPDPADGEPAPPAPE